MPLEMLDLAKQPIEQVLLALKPTKLTKDTSWMPESQKTVLVNVKSVNNSNTTWTLVIQVSY